MMQIMTCTGCRASGTFSIQMEYGPKPKACATCHHDETRKWSYQFCTMSCFLKWTKEIAKSGVPCEECIGTLPGTPVMGPTGFHLGFEVNGTCPICHGKKTVKGTP